MSDIKDLTSIVDPYRNFQAKTPPCRPSGARGATRDDAIAEDEPGLSGRAFNSGP
jgi:hypothetical protein